MTPSQGRLPSSRFSQLRRLVPLVIGTCCSWGTACNLDSTGSASSTTVEAGGAGGQSSAEDSCPRGVTVLLSDYLSSQVAFSDLNGRTLTEAVLSTGSARTDGLAFALSGDVVLPSAPSASGKVVLLDRFGTNVVTWLDPRDGQVVDQLPVGTGFESNPQDYVELDQDLAVISRFGQNSSPGREPFDDGDDLILVDLEQRRIVDNWPLPRIDALPARPGPMTRIGETVWVTLLRIAPDFSSMGDAALIGMNATSRKLSEPLILEGRKNCGKLTLSPDQSRAALACSGRIDHTGVEDAIEQSALLLFDTTGDELSLRESFEAEELVGGPLQSSIAFADDQRLLFKTQTPLGGETHNRLMVLDLSTGRTSTVLQARPDKNGLGRGIVFGGLLCSPGCDAPCLLADADRRLLQRIALQEDGSLRVLDPIAVEQRVGLPPLGLSHR